MSIGDPIFVLNGHNYYEAVKNLGPRETDIKEFIRAPKRFQFVLFTGGEDISPELYGHTSPKGLCVYNDHRDYIEQKVYEIASKNNIKMVGICRGLQFLTAMAGGELIHHLNDHAGWEHKMILKTPWRGKKEIVVNSYHHQMCLPPENSVVLGHAPKTITKGYYIGDEDKLVEWNGADVEAMYLPNVNAFGVQWHPEMLRKLSYGYLWFNNMVDLFINKKEMFANTTMHKEMGA
jgi:putative glutamine amidotransferase